jgi:hypothetical protein
MIGQIPGERLLSEACSCRPAVLPAEQRAPEIRHTNRIGLVVRE